MEKENTGEVRLSRVFILVSLVCLSLFVFHQDALAAVTGKIAGRIVDIETGEPLPAVNVLLVGTEKGAATDADGYYYIINNRIDGK